MEGGGAGALSSLRPRITKMPITLVFADNYPPLILDALENLFRAEEGFQVLARCRDGVERRDGKVGVIPKRS